MANTKKDSRNIEDLMVKCIFIGGVILTVILLLNYAYRGISEYKTSSVSQEQIDEWVHSDNFKNIYNYYIKSSKILNRSNSRNNLSDENKITREYAFLILLKHNNYYELVKDDMNIGRGKFHYIRELVKLYDKDLSKFFRNPELINDIKEGLDFRIGRGFEFSDGDKIFYSNIIHYLDTYKPLQSRENLLGALEKLAIESGEINHVRGIKRNYSDQIRTNKSRISRLENRYKKIYDKSFVLRGIMISLLDKGYNRETYEISVSGSRAILITNNTSFQSRGMFTLRVVETGEMPITLRQEYGGFDTQWPVYVEIPSDEYRKNTENNMKILSEIETYSIEIESMERRIESINKMERLHKEEFVDFSTSILAAIQQRFP